MARDIARAAAAVEAAMAARGWNVRDLANRASIDAATAGDFLAGTRWPRTATRGRIESALGWAPGTISQVAAGGRAPDPSTGATRTSDDWEAEMWAVQGVSDEEKRMAIATIKARRAMDEVPGQRRAQGE